MIHSKIKIFLPYHNLSILVMDTQPRLSEPRQTYNTAASSETRPEMLIKNNTTNGSDMGLGCAPKPYGLRGGWQAAHGGLSQHRKGQGEGAGREGLGGGTKGRGRRGEEDARAL